MSGRRSSAPTISLFSFQDIITSVTAVIILVTLLLAVELINRHLKSAPESAPAVSAAAIRRSIADAEAELTRLRAQLASKNRLLLRGAGTSAEIVARQHAAVRAQITSLTQEIHEARVHVKRLAHREQELRAQRQGRTVERRQAEAVRTENARLRNKLKQLEDENVLVYRDASAGKRAWLVDIWKDRISVARVGSVQDRQTFGISALTGANEFTAWARSRNAAGEYFVLLIRPGGTEHFDSIQARLQAAGFDIGFDLLGSQHKLMTEAEATK